MKSIEFKRWDATTYVCVDKGDQSGEYVRAEVAEGLLEALHNTLSLAELKYALTDDTARACFKQARAAIAAAKGE